PVERRPAPGAAAPDRGGRHRQHRRLLAVRGEAEPVPRLVPARARPPGDVAVGARRPRPPSCRAGGLLPCVVGLASVYLCGLKRELPRPGTPTRDLAPPMSNCPPRAAISSCAAAPASAPSR